MSWVTIAALLAQYGLPFVDKLMQKINTNGAPTDAEWQELKALAQNNSKSMMVAALNRAGIPLDDPKAVALLAQV